MQWLSTVLFITFIIDAALLSSWYQGSSFHYVGSLTKKLCAFVLPFTQRTSKITAVLCVMQLAMPVGDNGSGELSRCFRDSSDSEVCHHLCSHIISISVVKERKTIENVRRIPEVSAKCICGSLSISSVQVICKCLQKMHVI